MSVRRPYLSRPLYEALPWIYIIVGLAALFGSYSLAAHAFFSMALGLFGLFMLIAGSVVLLRRREYRALRARYGEPGELEPTRSSEQLRP
jgi:hypothetical protein